MFSEAHGTASDIHVGHDLAGKHVLIALTPPGSDQVEVFKVLDPVEAVRIAQDLLKEAAICRAVKS